MIIKKVNRIIMYIVGIFLLALGGVLAIKSNLGASPVSSLPLSISKVTTISLGAATTALFITYVALQIVILKRDFKLIQLLQVIFAMLFGKIMNFFNIVININVESFYIRVFICILSFFITAFGILFTITADIVPVAPDGLAQAISRKMKIEFGKAKIYFDCVVVILSLTILLINNKGIDGLGIGTILSALLVGRILSKLKLILGDKIENLLYDVKSEKSLKESY